MTEGRVRRAYLGVAGAPRPLPPAARAEWGADACLELAEIVAGSPAERAGLLAGDLLVELGGVRVTGVADVLELMEHEVIGTHLTAVVLRDGLERRLQVVPIELG